MIRHIVLIKFFENTQGALRQEALERLQRLGADCGGEEEGILEFRAGFSLDTRKADMMLVSLFASHDALQRYRANQNHAEYAEFLRKIADWWAANMETNN